MQVLHWVISLGVEATHSQGRSPQSASFLKKPADSEASSHVNGGQARPNAVARFEGYELRLHDTGSESSSCRIAISQERLVSASPCALARPRVCTATSNKFGRLIADRSGQSCASQDRDWQDDRIFTSSPTEYNLRFTTQREGRYTCPFPNARISTSDSSRGLAISVKVENTFANPYSIWRHRQGEQIEILHE